MRLIKFPLLMVLLCASLFVAAQDCKVSLKAIAGKYSGDCLKGKADGKGTSEGTDKYTGDFKEGYPEGTGVYTAANGDVYEGSFIKGQRSGQGKLTTKGGVVTAGFWEKNAYKGKFEKPFIIHTSGSSITSNDIKKDRAAGSENSISLNISNTTAGGTSLLGGVFPKPVITELVVLKGTYGDIVDGLETQSGIKKTISRVTFPFRALLVVDGQRFDFEILDEGTWNVTLQIQANLRQGKAPE